MFDIGIGFSELLVIGVIALIIVGPEDLPALLRTLGRYVGSIKRVADDFRAEFSEALKETEVDKLKSPFDDLQSEFASAERTMSTSMDGENLIDFEEHNRRVLDNEKNEQAARQESSNTPAAGVASETPAGNDDLPLVRKEGL